MIVTCPNCETRFSVEDESLGGEAGRRLRCASCGNIWRYTPEAAEIQAAVAEVTHEADVHAAAGATAAATTHAGSPAGETAHAGARAEGHPYAPAPLAQSRPSVAVEIPAAAREREKRAIGLGLIVFAAGLVLIFVLARDTILRLWPSTAVVYEALRLVEPAGAGLEVSVTPTRTADSVIIDGNIVNRAGAVRQIPRLRVTLRDGYKVDLDSKIIAPPVARLPPGGTARFSTVFEHPSITAAGVEVTFATE